MKHRPRSLRSFGVFTFCFAAAALVGCANSESGGGDTGSGGTSASGEGGSTGGGDTGGSTAKGGTTGTGVAGTNGSTGVGGTRGSTTGTAGTFGVAGTNGTAGTFGIAGTNGGTGTGGAKGGTTGTTGIAGTNGGTGTGGAKGGTTGTAGTTGIAGTTGRAGTSGSAGTTGRAGTTGTAGTTGIAGTTGTGTGGSPACTAGPAPTGGKTITGGQGTADGGYTYNFYTNGQGSASMTVYGVAAEFSATWSNPGDFLARVGLGWNSTQTPSQLGTVTATFAETKTGTGGGYNYIGIYGWSENPLHEYYIVEDWFGTNPPNPGGTKVGQITVDGGTYNVYQHTQTNQPSITGGNATFVQFFSVRTSPRTCGTISISQHFSQWASMGLQLGNMEEARIVVEVGGGSGSGNITFSTATVTKS